MQAEDGEASPHRSVDKLGHLSGIGNLGRPVAIAGEWIAVGAMEDGTTWLFR